MYLCCTDKWKCSFFWSKGSSKWIYLKNLTIYKIKNLRYFYVKPSLWSFYVKRMLIKSSDNLIFFLLTLYTPYTFLEKIEGCFGVFCHKNKHYKIWFHFTQTTKEINETSMKIRGDNYMNVQTSYDFLVDLSWTDLKLRLFFFFKMSLYFFICCCWKAGNIWY